MQKVSNDYDAIVIGGGPAGSTAGALLAVRIGARLIKPLLVVVCVALAIKLLSDPANPLRMLAGF